jgi:hypothetical protein
MSRFDVISRGSGASSNRIAVVLERVPIMWKHRSWAKARSSKSAVADLDKF